MGRRTGGSGTSSSEKMEIILTDAGLKIWRSQAGYKYHTHGFDKLYSVKRYTVKSPFLT